MPKRAKKELNVDYLSMFKQSLTMSFMFFLFGGQDSYAAEVTNITPNTNTFIGNKTQVGVDDNGQWQITGGHLNGTAGFHHFSNFFLQSGDIANLQFDSGASKYVNFVDTQVGINGVFNAIKNGAVGGNVVFVSPQGMVVGSTGVLNVGSLQLMTPTTGSYNSVIGLGAGITESSLNNLVAGSSSDGSSIQGKIFSSGSVNLADGKKISLGNNSDIVAGFAQNGFTKAIQEGDLSQIVRTDGIIDAAHMSGTSSNIVLHSKEVTAVQPQRVGGLVQATGDVTFSTPDGDNAAAVLSNAKISAGGNVSLGRSDSVTSTVGVKNDIIAGGNVTFGASDITITQNVDILGDTVSLQAIRSNSVSGNLTADKGIKLSSGGTTQLLNSVNIENKTSGNVEINAATLNQTAGTTIKQSGNGDLRISGSSFNQADTAQVIHNGSGNLVIDSNNFTQVGTAQVEHRSTGDLLVNSGSVVQGDGSTVKHKGAGKIDFHSSSITQGESTISHEGAGDIIIYAPSDDVLNTVVANNGDIEITTSNLTLKDTITSKNGDITVSSLAINQTDYSKTAFDASNHLAISATGNLGNSESETLKVSSSTLGVSVGIDGGNGFIDIVGDKDTDIKSAINFTELNIKTDNALKISGNVDSYGDLNITAAKGIEQSQNSSIYTVEGDVNVKNTTSGHVITGEIETSYGGVTIENTTGDVLLGGTILAAKDVGVDAQNISQNHTRTAIDTNGTVNLNATEGSVGLTSQRVIVSADGDVIVDASNAVNIEGHNTNIDLAKINAGTDINLGTTGTGEVLLGGAVHNANGSIQIDTEKKLEITNNITAIGSVQLESQNGIVQTQGTLIQGGCNDNPNGSVVISNNGEGDVIVTDVLSNGDVRVENMSKDDAVGNVSVGNIQTTNGTIRVNGFASNGSVTLNGILDSTGEIRVVSKSDINQNENALIQSGNHILLSSENGAVGSEGQAIRVNADGVVSTDARKDIYLESPGEDLRLGSIFSNGGNIDIKTTDLDSAVNKNIVLTESVNAKNVKLDAKGSILQDTTDITKQTIFAQDSITLVAQTGDIGDTYTSDVKSVVFKTNGSFSATASSGSAALTGVETNISTEDINAAHDLDITTVVSGDISIDQTKNYTGYVKLNSVENVTLNNAISATENIEIKAISGNVTQNADLDTTVLTSGQDISIEAQNIGDVDKYLVIDAAGKIDIGTVENHAKNVYLQDTSGDMTIGQLYADTNLILKAQADILQAQAGVDSITSTGNVVLESATGNIGVSDTSPLEVNITGESGLLSVTNSKNLYVASNNGSLTTGSISAENVVYIDSADAINISGKIETDTAVLEAERDITQDVDIETAIKAKTIDLTSKSGNIGTPDTGADDAVAIGISLKSTEGSIDASATEGSVVLKGINTSISTGDIQAKNSIDLSTIGTGSAITVTGPLDAQGYIKLDSAEKLEINNTIDADGYISINSAEQLKINNNITAGKYITAQGSEIITTGNLDAGEYVDLQASGELNVVGDITSDSYISGKGTNVSISGILGAGDYADLKATGTLQVDSDITADSYIKANGESITTNGVLGAGEYIDLNSSDDLNVGGNLTAGTNITVSGTNVEISGQIDAGIYTELLASDELKINNDVTAGSYISVEGNGITTAGVINAGESVVLKSTDILSIENDINAGSYIEGQGTEIITDGILNADTDVDLSSSGKINIKNDVTAGERIILNANGGIVQAADKIMTSGTLSTTKGQGNITITNNNGGEITVNNAVAHNGDIQISNTEAIAVDSAITVGNLTANDGLVNITNAVDSQNIILDGLTQSGSDIEITAKGNIINAIDNNDKSLSAVDNITLKANGSIGSSISSLKLSAGKKVSVTGVESDAPTLGGIYLNSVNSTLTTGIVNSSDNINIQATGDDSDIIITDKITGSDISLQAGNNIIQNIDSGVLDSSIVATGDLSLIAEKGNLGVSGNSIDFSADGNLTAFAERGSVFLNGIGTDINTDSIRALKDIDLSGKTIKVSSEISTDEGYISLKSDENLELNHNLVAGKHIVLNANGGIVQTEGSSISSGNNATTSVGDGYISIVNNDGGDIVIKNATANKGDIIIENRAPVPESGVTGNVTIGSVNTTNGSIAIYNNIIGGDVILESVVDSSSTINVGAVGDIVQKTTNTGVSLNANDNIILRTQGDIENVKLNSGAQVTADGVNVEIESIGKDLNIAGVNSAKESATGNISLKTTGNGSINIQGIIKGAEIQLTSSENISQDSSLTKSIDATEKITLDAQGNIGIESNAIDFSNTGITIANSGASVNLNGVDSNIIIGGVSAVEDVNITTSYLANTDVGNITIRDSVQSTTGAIKITSAKGIDVNDSIDSATNITLTSNDGNVSIDGELTATSDFINIKSAKAVDINNSLISGSNINIDAYAGNVDLSADLTAVAFIDITSNGSIVQDAGQILANGQNAQNYGVNISANGGSVGISDIKTTSGAVNISSEKITDGATEKSGDITVGDIVSVGQIVIKNTGTNKDIIITSQIDATNSLISIDTTGDIYQTVQDFNALKTTSNIELNAGQNIGKASTEKLLLDTNGTVLADGTNVYLNGTNGLNIAGINKDKLTTQGITDISTTAGNINISGLINSEDITLNSAGAISQANSLANAIKGKNVSLKTQNGGIGANGNSLDVDIDNTGLLSADAKGNVYLNGTSDNLNLGSISTDGNDLKVDSVGGLKLNDLIDANDVNLRATSDITQDSSITQSIKANNLTIISDTGNIGTPDSVDTIETDESVAIGFSTTGSMSADAYRSIVLKGIDTDITTNQISAGENIDLSTTGTGKITISDAINAANGYINLDSAADLEVSETLTASKYVSVSGKDVFLNQLINAGTDIEVNATNNIIQSDSINDAVLSANRDINISAGGNVGLSTKSILLNSNGTVDVSAQNVHLSSPNNDLTLGAITAFGNGAEKGIVNISTTGTTNGNILLNDVISGKDIKLDSCLGISQDSNLSKSIDASNKLTLIAQDGDIGVFSTPPTPVESVKFSANTIEAHADNGSIAITGVDSTINIESISAEKNYDIATTGTGDINLNSEFSTDTGYININSAKDINVNSRIETNANHITLNTTGGNISLNENANVLAGTDLTLNASGNIVQNTTETALNSIGDINITAGGYAGADKNNALLLNANDTVNVLSATNTYLKDSSGELKIGTINVSETADLWAQGQITQNSSGTGISANKIELYSESSDIGADGAAIKIDNDGIVKAAANSGSVYLTGSALNISDVVADSVAKMTSTDTINLGGLIDTDTAVLNATNDITQSTDGVSITAKTIELTSTAGNIGSPDSGADDSVAIGISLKSTDGNIDANAAQSVVLKGIDTTISTGNISAGNSIDLSTTGEGEVIIAGALDAQGYIKLDSAKALEVNNTIEADGYVSLNSAEVLNINSNISAGEQITAKGSSISTTGSLNAGEYVELDSISELNIGEDISAGSYIKADANGITTNGVLGAGEYIDLNSSDDLSVGDNLTAGTNITVSGENVEISGQMDSGDYVDLKANGTLYTDKGISADSYIKAEANGITTNGVLGAGEYIDLNSSDDLNVRDNLTAGTNITVSGENVEILGQIESGDYVDLKANGTLYTDKGIFADSYIKAEANGITTNGVLDAGEYVDLNSNAELSIGEDISAGSHITLNSNGGIVQSTGEITSGNNSTITDGTGYISITNDNGGIIDIKNAIAKKGDIDILNNQVLGGQPVSDGDIKLGIITSNTGSVTITNNILGKDIILDSLISASTGVDLSSKNNIYSTSDNLAIDSQAGLNLTAGNNIGLSTTTLLVNVAGKIDVNKDSNGVSVYLSGQDSDLSMGAINVNDVVSLQTQNAHTVTLNESISANTITVDSAGDINIEKNISGQNSVILEAEKSFIQESDSNIASMNGNVDVSSNDGDMTLNGSLMTQNGDISVSVNNGNLTANGTLSSQNGSVFVNNNSTSDTSLTVNSVDAGQNIEITHDGNGLLTVNGNLINNGASTIMSTNNGLNAGVKIAGNLSNKGSLSIESNGSQGLNVLGNIDNNIITGSNINISNQNGDLILSSGAITNKFGNNINITNSGDGKLDINSDIVNYGTLTAENQGALGVDINTNIINSGSFDLTNNGNGGLNINSEITNAGNFVAENNSGSLTLGGVLNAQKGSTSTFEQNGNGDLIIGSEITSNGGMLNFENSGTGSTVLNQDAYITVYSILDNGTIYTGNLNILNNGSAGNIQIDGKISGLSGKDSGFINISNTSNKLASSIIFSDSAQIDAQNNSFVVNNSGAGGITFADDLTVKSNEDISINNQGTDGLKFGNDFVLNGENLNIENNSGDFVLGSANNFVASSNMNIQNNGTNGIILDDRTIISANNALEIENSGTAGISVDGTINAKDISIKNDGLAGISVDGLINGNTVSVENNNSNISLAHNTENGNINATDILSITVNNGNLLNSNTNSEPVTNKGLVSGGSMKLAVNNGSIGVLDTTLDSIIQAGFDLDSHKSIHISTGGNLIATAGEDMNITTSGQAMNITSLSAKNALLSAFDSSINAGTITTENLYMLAKGQNASLNIESLTNTGKMISEADKNTTINSNSALNIDSMLSNNGSVSIKSEGNVSINEIAATEDISIVVEDEKLSINNLGRVERNNTIIPKTVNLTVRDAKSPTGGVEYKEGMTYEEIQNVQPQSTLDIYNAYVKEKATLKADVINAGVYDVSDGTISGQKRVDSNGNEATGFHNANPDGKLEFDIQGSNVVQEEIVTDPINEYYSYDPEDKRAHVVNLTLGDSVDNADFGFNFKKLFADYAFIDTLTTDPDAVADITIENAIIKEVGIIRNNENRLDIINNNKPQDLPINKHYEDTADLVVKNQIGFSAIVNDSIEMDVKPPAPEIPLTPEYLEENNPQKIVKIPTYESTLTEPNPHDNENATTDETINTEELNNDNLRTDNAHLWKNIRWIVKKDNSVVGSSDKIELSSIKSLVKISKNSVVFKTRRDAKEIFKKGENVSVFMSQKKKSFETVGQVYAVKNDFVEIRFNKLDKAAQNILLFWCMEKENL